MTSYEIALAIIQVIVIGAIFAIMKRCGKRPLNNPNHHYISRNSHSVYLYKVPLGVFISNDGKTFFEVLGK